MESDICGANVSPTLVNRTEKIVVDGDCSSLLSLIEKKEEEEEGVQDQASTGSDVVTNVTVEGQTVTQSDIIKPQNDQDSVSDDESDGYYEVISADGSIGGDDVNNDISNDEEDESHNNNNNLDPSTSNDGFTVSEDQSLSKTCSFNDLPFVPKYEFPHGQNDDAPNYGVLHRNMLISNNIPRPDKNFTIPPPNFKPLDVKPSLDFTGPLFNQKIQNPVSIKLENINTVSEKLRKNKKPSRFSSSKDEALRNVPGSSKEKSHVVDWLDENGDPVPGAFDYVKQEESEEEPGLNKSSKVEYVFSVRDKKDVPVKSEPDDVVNTGFLINQNVLHKNVAGNLGVLLENQLVPDPARVFHDDEEKKLYEASKSGAEYKAAVTATSSTTDTSPTVIKVVPENDNTNKDRFPRFRRNRFTDIKKEDEPKIEETSEEKPTKSTEEVALERLAVTEILKEVQRGAARAREHGALGWQKCPVPVTNKTFLRNTLVSTLREPYRPPSKRGRFHVGLKKEDSGKEHGKQEHDTDSRSSRSSRSRSHSSSRSCSSCSRSGSSFTDDGRSRSRDRKGHFPRGGGRGSWHRGHHQYYDEAWAAYNAHYGYPWYGQEALPMFYGPEGWPMDPYAAMYYGDPQAWMEYEAYYGPPNFNSRGAGRGFRGRGRGDRGRGRGGYEGDFRDYNQGFRSPRELSPQRSRSGLSRSWSRDRSRSRSRVKSVDSRSRSRSHSLSHSHTYSHSKSRRRSRDRSLGSKSDSKVRSDTEMNGKKKKKKKKKKKHKKSKKSKHKRKGEENESNKKGAEEIVEGDAEKDQINNEIDNKDRKEENSNTVRKEDGTLKQKEKQSYKHKKKGKNKKEIRNVDKTIEKKDGSNVSGNMTEIKGKVIRQSEHKDMDVQECSTQKIDRQSLNAKEVKRRVDSDNKINEIVTSSENRRKKHKSSYSQCIVERVGPDGLRASKSREEPKENADFIGRESRSCSQDNRKRRLNDLRIEDATGQHDTTDRGRSESQDSRKRMRISDHGGNDGRVETSDKIGSGRCENQDSRKGIRMKGNRDDGRVGVVGISGRDKTNESQESRKRKSGHRVDDGTVGVAGISGIDKTNESQESRKRKSGHRDDDGTVGVASISGRGENQEIRKRKSGHIDDDGRAGVACISGRGGTDESQESRMKKIGHSDDGGTVGVAGISGRDENQESRMRKIGHRVDDGRAGVAGISGRGRTDESQESRMRKSGHRVKDRLGTTSISETDRKGGNQDNRKGVIITDEGDKDIRLGMADVSDRRSESKNSKKRIGDSRNMNETYISSNITERDTSEGHDHKDKGGKDSQINKYGSNTVETERCDSHNGREGVIKDGEKRRRGIEKESIESHDSMEEARQDYDKQRKNIKYKVKDGSHTERKGIFEDSHEITKTNTQKNTEGRSERSQTTKNDRISEKDGIKHKFLTSQTKDNDNDESIEINKKIYDSKEESKFGTEQKSLQTDKKRESYDKKTAVIRSVTKYKRSRSHSTDSRVDSDENVDKKQAGEMICGSATSIYGKREISNNRDKTEERYKESRKSYEKDFSHKKINKLDKGSMRNNENLTADNEMKNSNLEKQRDRNYESGSSCIDRNIVQGIHKDSKEKPHRENQGYESQQHNREKCKESSKPEKFEHKKVIHPTQQNNENDITVNSKNIGAKSLDFTKESNTDGDVAHTKKYSNKIHETTSESKAMIENKLKGVKQSKKLVKKLEAKNLKPIDFGEARGGGESLVSESSGEFRKKTLKLKQRKKLKEGPQEGKKSSDIPTE